MANSVDPDQTAPKGAVFSGSMLFASIFNLSVMLGNYFQQTTFSDAFFLGALRVKTSAKNSSENSACFVVCCKFLLTLFNKVKYRDKQCGPRSDCSYRSSLI